MDIDGAKQRFEAATREWLAATCAEPLSETDTRCKAIDFVLKDVLGWPESAIRREPHVAEVNGYIDYILTTTRPAFIVEAKRTSVLFKLPKIRGRRQFKVGGVLSEDAALRDAIDQARSYALAENIPFCCVTNGSQYVFFRASNDLGIKFDEHLAVVFESLDDIAAHFLDFATCLSFVDVSEGRHFQAISPSEDQDGSLKFKRLSQARPTGKFRNRNKLFPFIREVVAEVFQDLASDSATDELIEQCYVATGRDSSYDESLRALLKDRPTFAELNVDQLVVQKKGVPGFEKIVDKNGLPEVLLLLGGIGAGKSTFIQRFRKVIAKKRIDEECIWAYVNFNHYTDEPDSLGKWAAAWITQELERDYPELEFGSYSMLKAAYHAEYERLKRGRMKPIFDQDPSEFEREFAKSLESYEQDRVEHLIRLLKAAAARSRRRVILIFDNADQFGSSLQNDVFMLARRVAQSVGCSLIISLREESYWKNKDYGALSAFHTTNFHVEAPRIKQVVSKRFKYAAELLKDASDNYVVPSGGLGVTPEEGVEVFEAIKTAILGDDPSAIDFLERMSPGEVRRPLDQLSRFLFSGHTNIDAVLNKLRDGFVVGIGFHEFFKSVALGDREFFDERRSDIVNLFALDGGADASNLNRLVVLGRVLKAKNDHSDIGIGWLNLQLLISECVARGFREETVLTIVDFLNSRRILETEQQSRESARNASFVRATTAGDYYVRDLARRFVYVDLVLPGTSIAGDLTFDIIERITRQIDALGSSIDDRFSKLELRIERSRAFVQYLAAESRQRAELASDEFVDPLVIALLDGLDAGLEVEGRRVLDSAKYALFHHRGRHQ